MSYLLFSEYSLFFSESWSLGHWNISVILIKILLYTLFCHSLFWGAVMLFSIGGYVYLLTSNTQDFILFTLIMLILMGRKLYLFVTLIYIYTVVGILVFSHWCSVVPDMNHSRQKFLTLALNFRVLSVIVGVLWRSRKFCNMVCRKQKK